MAAAGGGGAGGGGSCLSLLSAGIAGLQYVLPCLPGLIFLKYILLAEMSWMNMYETIPILICMVICMLCYIGWGRIPQQVPAPVGIERQMKESAVQLPASEKACVLEQSGLDCLLKDEFFYFEKHL